MCYPATVAATNLLNTPISSSCQSSSTSTRTADDCPLPPQKINRYTDLELHDEEQHDEDRQDLTHFPKLARSSDDSERPHRPHLLQLQQRKRSFTEYQLSLETKNTIYNKATIDLSSESLTTLSFKSLSLSSTTSLDDIDVSGHGDDMDDDSIDMDMLSISSSSSPRPPTTIRLAARPQSFSPINSAAFTPSVVSRRVSPIKQLSTLFSSTGLNTFTPIQVQDDNDDDTTTKTSFRKSPYLW